MDLYPKNRLSVEEVRKFLWIFFGVGVLGFLFPFTYPLFVKITPLALLLTIYLLSLYHENYDCRTWFAFGLVYLIGFGVEVIGVNTGMIFGSYRYGQGLGVHLFNTPLLIGLNWLFLAYCSSSIADRITSNSLLRWVISPSLMLSYDLLLEQLAPRMDMWSWSGDEVPLRNYIAWWIIGLGCVAVLRLCKVQTRNPLATVLFVAQFLFLLLLYILFR